MDKHEAQLLLSACRPGDLDAGDPMIKEALQVAQQDPEMARWFATEQQMDAVISGKLASLPVPGSLKNDILAGMRVQRRQSFWHSRWTWLAAAAAVTLAGYLSFPGKPGPVASLAEYRSDVAAAFASLNATGFRPALGVSSMAEVASYVSSQHAPLGNPQRPGGLTQVKPVACRVIEWRGQKVSIICVGRNDLEAHVFVVDRHAIRDLGDSIAKDIVRSSDYPVVAWEDKDHAYVMVGNTKTTDLKKLL